MPARFAEDVITDNGRSVPMDLGGRHVHHSPIIEDIAISGFSARLPESSNIEEFKRNLFDGVDMVNNDPRRWESGLYGLPERIGKIKDDDLQNFDQQFFGVHQKQAESMDPQLRMLLECSHEAILDAGINPVDLRGSRTGVYVGVSNSDTEQHWISNPDRVNGYGLVGCARAMFPNRISFAFDFKGPSYSVDTACSSSLYAFEQAFSDMHAGKCDNALVAGVNVLLKPTMSLQFKRLSMLSPDGMCKSFDEDGKGYVRSDGCVVLFLQRTVCAKRVYATVLNVRTNVDGYKEQGITFPDGRMQNRLIQETYKEINLDPNEVVYVEAHGTGTKVGDPQEVNSITDFFCKNRKTPLLIGSVKSNMGHSEPASGVCSIAKVLIAMEEGVIPGNLHYSNPNPDLYGLMDGRLKVVDKNTPWNGGIVGINSFGFGGANAHLILRSNPKPKAITPRDGPPKLVVCSGRTYDAVAYLLEDAKDHHDDDEYLTIINDIYARPLPQYQYRGYCVMNAKGTLQREVMEFSDEKRPIWYIYSGMGSQWASMAKDLMHFDVFNQSIHRCAEALRPEGVDLVDVLIHSTDKSFENILNSFISIAAMQVALTDLLTSLNIQPEGILGHSVGELGCAYADGCFTAEQTVLAAYWRGKSIVDTQLPKGKMAALGLRWEEAVERIPTDCFPVCHNSIDNCTISGPESSIDAVVEKLSAEGVFARAVNSSGYAFHSKYIADAGPKLRKSLEKIIPNAKNRSPRWLSTSIPESAWNTAIAKQSSAAYHVNNLLSPVLFYEALQHIPENAICIEIAPTGLLQAILKRAVGKAVHLSLVKRNHENNVQFLLSNIGKLYAAGAQPQVLKLYRPVSYPVGRGTPMLNSKIGWDHSQRWMVPKFGADTSTGETIYEVDLSKEGDEFLAGHTIDGRILFPATGYMTLAWMTFAKMRGIEMLKSPVIMENIVLHRATILTKGSVVKFGVNFFEGTGAFEICEAGSLAVSGRIYVPVNVDAEELPLEPLSKNTSKKEMTSNDVYKELRLRGYDYSGIFRGIIESDTTSTVGNLQWSGNWISFIDTMLQFSILSKNLRDLYLPTRIEKAIINPAKHLELASKVEVDVDQQQVGLPVYFYSDINVIKSGGVELRGLKASLAQKRPTSQAPTLERYTFIPQINKSELHENTEKARLHAITVALHLVIENSEGALKLKGVELADGRSPDTLMADKILNIIEGLPNLTADVAVATSNNNNEKAIATAMGDCGVRVVAKSIVEGPVEQNSHFVFGLDVLSRTDSAALENSIATIKNNGFLIFEENLNAYTKNGANVLEKHGYTVVQEQNCGGTRVLVVARKALHLAQRNYVVVNVTEKNFEWLADLKKELATAVESADHYVLLVCQGEELFGAVGLMNCIKNENGGKNARLIFIQDAKAETFSLSSPLYRKQLEKDLITQVLKNGVWGTFKHLKLESDVATLQVEHAYVNALVKGDLGSLKWVEGPQAPIANNNNDLEMCTVYYAPINFRDVMLSTGKLNADALPGDLAQQDCVLGLEFAGRDSSGRRIMAMVSAKSLATMCLASKRMMWQVPNDWSMEEASTVPCVYATVYYALVVRGEMKKGEKILIHAGSGGVGQAAISVALHHGLTVFTTVGSKEKREFLLQRFPKLQSRHIGNSRDTSFEQLVMRETQGRGVDLVLNSLAEEKLQASVRCLGLNGRFLEIGKFDLSNNSPLGMSVFLKNTSFHGILLDSVMEGEDSMKERVVSLVAEGIKSGAVRPLPTSVFNETQIEQAFRFMASGKHIGKVVVKIRDEEDGRKSLKPVQRLINAIPRTYMHPEKSYVLIGGLGGFGLELVNWLVTRGARFIVLSSRSGVKTGYQALMVRRWEERGVKVVIDTNDITTLDGCKKLLENANTVATVGGIFNLAAVLRDALLEDQTVKDFQTVCDAKVTGTKHLDLHSRDLCPELDYFVCFSSVSCGRGNIGQTNYGLANSAMERICEQRQASGFPGTAIQWGAIGDTGLVIDTLGDNDTVIGGTMPQRMVSCLQTIDLFLQQPHPVLASMVVGEKRKADQSGGSSLITAVANILGLRDLRNVQGSATLADLGMDSLMSAEIKQTLERNFDIVMAAPEIRKLTFDALEQLSGGAAPEESSSDATAATVSPTDSTPSPFPQGLQIVFNKELMPTEAIVQVKSAASSTSKKRPIFFVSPIEGFVDALKPLAERLGCPVYGLQCTAEATLDSLDTLAEFYLKKLRTVQPKGPYAIAGYSFGAAIAFVMVLQLEKNKESAELVMLDGAPKYVNWYTQNFKQLRNKSNSVDQNEAHGLAYFGMLCANIDYGDVSRLLVKIPTFESKVEKCAEIISVEINQPIELIIQAATAFYKKLLAADQYNPSSKVSCAVTLIKPTENYAKLEEDYGLKEVCNNKVEVVTVEGNHRTFLQEKKSLNTIESILKRLIV